MIGVRMRLIWAAAGMLAVSPLPARIVIQAGTAGHYNANHFVTGSRQSGARFGHAFAVGDFNADGFDDLAIGIPYQDDEAGAVMVVYGDWRGLRPGSPAALHDQLVLPGSRFGWSLAAGDVDGDGYDDLAVGAPFADRDGAIEAGEVVLLRGSVGGLTLGELWHQNVSGVSGVAQTGDRFGWSLAMGDFDADGGMDLAIGGPGDSPTSPAGSGAVMVLRGDAGGLGLTSTGHHYWYQDASGVPGAGETGDEFGFALAAGDLNLDGFDDLAIGVPGEAIGALSQAGAVNLLFGSMDGLSLAGYTSHLLLLTQDHANTFDQAEQGDRYGHALAIGAWWSACIGACSRSLMVAAPYEAETTAERGLIQRWTSTSSGPGASTGSLLAYGSTGGRLGSAMAVGRLDDLFDGFDTLVAGEPGRDGGRGAVRLFENSDATVSPSYFSNAFGLERQADAGFGAAVAVGDFNGRGPDELVIASPDWDQCIGTNPPLCLPDIGLITMADDTLFADGFD